MAADEKLSIQLSRHRVFHASFGENPADKEILHVGTREAALDRASNLVHAGKREGDATLYEMTMHRPTPFVWADPGLSSEASETRLQQGGRWWQVNEDDPPKRPQRYVNETEDPGSFSYVAQPHHLGVLNSEQIPRSVLQQRRPTYTED